MKKIIYVVGFNSNSIINIVSIFLGYVKGLLKKTLIRCTFFQILVYCAFEKINCFLENPLKKYCWHRAKNRIRLEIWTVFFDLINFCRYKITRIDSKDLKEKHFVLDRLLKLFPFDLTSCDKWHFFNNPKINSLLFFSRTKNLVRIVLIHENVFVHI